MEAGDRRANQMAQRVITAVTITRTAPPLRTANAAALLDRPINEGIQVYPREVTDFAEALPTTTTGNGWPSTSARAGLRKPRSPGGEPGTPVSGSVSRLKKTCTGWCSSGADRPTGGIGGWDGAPRRCAAFLVGAAVSAGFVTGPDTGLRAMAQVPSRGEIPPPCRGASVPLKSAT